MALAEDRAARTRGFALSRISAPYGLMYQMRDIREGRSEMRDLEKEMFWRRSVGWVPGGLASSMASLSW